jgi:3-hydroxybutyryl-CoA dehydrogenase
MRVAQIQKVAVVGTGLMGHGIAQAFAQEGFQVNVTDTSESALAVVKDRIRSNLVTFVEEESINQNEAEEILARIHVFTNLGQAIREADFMTEAIFEDLEAKQSIFEEMEKYCSPDIILASNTSSFRMTDISYRMQSPERAIITHWFNPPHLVPLVEVVLGRNTAEETYRTTNDLLLKIKKVPIRVRQEIPGFLINRIQTAIHREMYSLLEMGAASAEDLDLAVKASLGFRLASIGPLLVRDLAGLDVLCRVEDWLVKEIDSSTEVNKILKDMVARGELGVKTGKGFFEFTPESVAAIIKERDRQFVHRLKHLYR